jgi:K+-sensing histidine kinase KdpD
LVFLREVARSQPPRIEGRKPTEELADKLNLVLAAVRGTPSEKVVRELQNELPSYDALVKDLVDLEMLRAGTYPFRLERLELGEALDRITGFLEPKANRLGVRLEFVDWEVPIAIRADTHSLARSIFNLVAHFLFHTRAGHAVQIEISGQGSTASVRISSTAPTFTLAELEATMNSVDVPTFVSMDRRPGRRRTLFLCRRLLDAMGASVSATAGTDGGGIVLQIDLPVGPVAPSGSSP